MSFNLSPILSVDELKMKKVFNCLLSPSTRCQIVFTVDFLFFVIWNVSSFIIRKCYDLFIRIVLVCSHSCFCNLPEHVFFPHVSSWKREQSSFILPVLLITCYYSWVAQKDFCELTISYELCSYPQSHAEEKLDGKGPFAKMSRFYKSFILYCRHVSLLICTCFYNCTAFTALFRVSIKLLIYDSCFSPVCPVALCLKSIDLHACFFCHLSRMSWDVPYFLILLCLLLYLGYNEHLIINLFEKIMQVKSKVLFYLLCHCRRKLNKEIRLASESERKQWRQKICQKVPSHLSPIRVFILFSASGKPIIHRIFYL